VAASKLYAYALAELWLALLQALVAEVLKRVVQYTGKRLAANEALQVALKEVTDKIRNSKLGPQTAQWFRDHFEQIRKRLAEQKQAKERSQGDGSQAEHNNASTGDETANHPSEEPQQKPPGSIDESAKNFNPKEKRIAQYLADEGHTVKALPESTVEGVRTPDALVDGKPVEFKTLDPGATSGTIKNQVNKSISGMGQARDIVIDARGAGLDATEAARGLDRVGGITRGKLDSVHIIGDGYDVQSSY